MPLAYHAKVSKIAVRLTFGLILAASSLLAITPSPATASTPVVSQTTSDHVIKMAGRGASTQDRHFAPKRALGDTCGTLASGSTTPPLMYCGGATSSGGDFSGVLTSPSQIVLVVYGAQWGTRGTDGNGYDTFSGDTAGMIPRLEAMYDSIGKGGELWSGVATQYCQSVAVGSTSCPNSNTKHVAYPAGGVFKKSDVVYANSSNAPSSPSAQEVRGAALSAAFAKGLPANTQYVVVSPPGTTPDGFNTSRSTFCAWHSWNRTFGLIYTNLPYLPDAGTTCGAQYFGSGADHLIDGVTVVASHEYSEVLTDPSGQFGWVDSNGWENGDLCAWQSTGPGAVQMVTMNGHSFAMQGTWSNATQVCAISAPVTANGTTIEVSTPTTLVTPQGESISLPLRASTTDQGSLSYVADGLPTGVSIGATTGIIAGTPTQTGTFTATIGITESTGATAIVFATLRVTSETITLTNPGTTTVFTNASISLPITAVDSLGASLSYAATGLPEGFRIASDSGIISGSSSQVTSSSVTVTATSSGLSRSITFTFIVTRAVYLTPVASQSIAITRSFRLAMVASTTTNSSLSYAAVGLPAGFVINSSTGIITGSATVPSTSLVTVTATAGSQSDGVTFSLSVVSKVTLTTPGSQSLQVGKPYSLQLVASDSGRHAVSFQASNLPAGLTISSSGLISGAPQTAGVVSVTLRATAQETVSGVVTFTVNKTVSISPLASQHAHKGIAFTLQPSVANSTGTTLTFTGTGLPAGISLNRTTGALTGAPTTLGSSAVTLTATAGNGARATATVSFVVTSKVTFSVSTPQSLTVSKLFSLTLHATDSEGGAITFGSSTLPDGLQLDPLSGVISGTPSTSGNTTVTLTATGGETVSLPVVFAVHLPTITLTSSVNLYALSGVPYSGTVTASDSAGLPVAFRPTTNCGLAVDANGVISGNASDMIPGINWTCVVTLYLSDSVGGATTVNLNLNIGPYVGVSAPSNLNLATGLAYSGIAQAFDAGGAALTFSSTSLPAGLVLNSHTGAITGTPTVPGSTTVIVTAKNPANLTGKKTFTFVVTRPSIRLTVPSSRSLSSGSSVSLSSTATDSAGETLSYSAIGLPQGLTISRSSGVISGRLPAALGPHTISVTASDPGGASATGTFVLTITRAP